MENKACSKCEGKGYLSYYAHVAGGTCFQCKGTGKTGGNNNKTSTKQIIETTFKIGDIIKQIGFKSTFKIIKITPTYYYFECGEKRKISSIEKLATLEGAGSFIKVN